MQLATLSQWLSGFTNLPWANNLRKLLSPLYDRQSSTILQTGGALVIKAGSSTLAKTGAATTYYVANGVLGRISAATDMAALAGTVLNTQFGVFVFFVDSAGALTTLFGGSYASLATMKWPQFPTGKACIGFVLINPTGTGNFIGGTTALDDATVVPTAAYVTIAEGFDPYCLIGGPTPAANA